ncbi:MAG: DUF4097 family beta strand repeat protein [Anaerolineae bacterium]|nr:DUF4097 family beta strand repeat protein [Gemmatimonadaceae bacterium]
MQRVIKAALLTALLVPSLAIAQESERDEKAFTWTGKIPAGSWVRVRNLNGGIDVEPGTGTDTEVRGEKKWRRGDPRDVRFEVIKDGDNVTICALWYEESSCDADGYHTRQHRDRERRNNDVNVHFTVKLPKGVKVLTSTVNGGIDIRGATAEAVAHTVNGKVDVATTTGPVEASTVNGGLRVRMDEIEGTGDMDFSTVNGSVTVEAPASLNADVRMSTVNGGVSSDYPLTIVGRIQPKSIRGTIGKGGRQLKLSTVNGSVELRKL